MNFEEIVNKFVEKPCRITTGAPSLSKRWGVDLDLVYQARAVAKDILKNKEEFGTEYNPEDVAFKPGVCAQGKYSVFMGAPVNKNWKPKSKWQTAGGEWRESFQYNNEESNTIDFESILNKVFSSIGNEKIELPVVKSGNMCAVYPITDQHIGMEPEGSLFQNHYSKEVYRDRMNALEKNIIMRSIMVGGFDTLSIDFLGDTFDGQDGYTVKRTHKLPQNMSNAQCFEVGLYTNKTFFERIFKSGCAKNYKVHFVKESNHGGDMDLYFFKSMKMWIESQYPQVEVKIANRTIDHYIIGNHAFPYTHGKDNLDMKNPMPYVLDKKTQSYINDYIDYYKINDYHIHFLKGDQHRFGVTNAKKFQYINCPALSGSSKWVMANYEDSKPGTACILFDKFNNEFTTIGCIPLQ